MLAKLQTDPIDKEIYESKGTAIYIFNDHQVNRAVGDKDVYLGWASQFPYYFLDGDKLLRNGNFTTGRPVLSFIYHLLDRCEICRFFNVNIPVIGDAHIYLTFKIVEESFELLRRQLKDVELYVVFYPGISSGYGRKLIEYLDSAGIKHIDYFDLFDRRDQRFVIQGDGHPSAYANDVLAKQLAVDLGIAGKQ
jgi:hypothetical protein